VSSSLIHLARERDDPIEALRDRLWVPRSRGDEDEQLRRFALEVVPQVRAASD